MWTYKSRTGEMLRPDGTRLGYGFSGNGSGLNNPAMQYEKNVGPLPRGIYKMTDWIQSHPKLGMCCIRLDPHQDTDMKGRSAFLIHGSTNLFTSGLDRFLHSSDGCIIIGDCISRRSIWNSADHELFIDPS